jgi:peptidoglycan/LPS O-acetylase OafA/YrhL
VGLAGLRIQKRGVVLSNSGALNYKLGYRSDIEGLRAVAILLVVAAHFRVPGFTGGFIGVDIFFVLSGYLITGLIVNEISTTNNFNFAKFYGRRIRRLLPALVLLLVCIALFGELLLTSIDQIDQAKAAGSASIWVSNFYFAFSDINYFNPDAKTNLFLHTWSLGVEEQFYLVWPVLILLVSGAWQDAKTSPKPDRLKLVMPAVFVASFMLCVWWSYHVPQLAFYMMPARAWQFALGALIFVYFGSPAASVVNSHADVFGQRGLLRLIGWIGLALIVGAGILLNEQVTYPGAWALVPSFGAAMILAVGAHSPQKGVGGLLSKGPMQAIGKVSYSWYLWHWPILLLGASVADIANPGYRCGLALLSFVIAVFSYWYIEAPIRKIPQLISWPRATVIGGVLIMIFVGFITLQWHRASMQNSESPAQERFWRAKWDAPIIYYTGCDSWYLSSKVTICKFGNSNAPHTAVAIGDSIGLQWFPAIQHIFHRSSWRLLVMTKSSCPLVDREFFYTRIGRVFTECSSWRDKVLKKIQSMRPDIVILGSTYTYPYTKDQWINGTSAILAELSSAAKHIYLLRSTPVLSFDGPICLAPRSWLYKILVSGRSCSSPAYSNKFDDVYAWQKLAADRFHNVSMIDMTDAVCPNGECKAERNGVIVFRDSEHITATFARQLGPSLARHIHIVDDR